MIYLHVPFCESFCTYCGFYSVLVPGTQRQNSSVILSEAKNLAAKNLCFDSYADAVCDEIASRRDEIASTSSVNTLYIGGGTPSVLPLDVISKVVSVILSEAQRNNNNVILSAAKNLPPFTEFTIEVNPEDIVRKGDEYVKGLLELGVNRISMGIQSFDDRILKWMNRRHDSAAAVEAFRILRRCGVGNISIDLIFGLPQLSESLWMETIDKALALKPEHISAYQLLIEEDSALEKLIEKGKFTEASDEQCRRQYDILCEHLGQAGYHHYEVSNFALPGREAVHNSAYWKRVPYVGLGPGAHSLSKDGVRSWNSCSVLKYSQEKEILSPEDIRIERIMLPLRTDSGLPEAELRSLAGDAPVDRLLSEGALVPCHSERSEESRSEESLRIPEDHFFTSDEIIRELI